MKVISSGQVIHALPFVGDALHSEELLLPNTNVKGGAFVRIDNVRLHVELARSPDVDTEVFRLPRFGIACQCVWDKYSTSVVNYDFHERCMFVGVLDINRLMVVEGETTNGLITSVGSAREESSLTTPTVVDSSVRLWSYGGSLSTVVDGGDLLLGAAYAVVDYSLLSLSSEEQLSLLRPVAGC